MQARHPPVSHGKSEQEKIRVGKKICHSFHIWNIGEVEKQLLWCIITFGTAVLHRADDHRKPLKTTARVPKVIMDRDMRPPKWTGKIEKHVHEVCKHGTVKQVSDFICHVQK